ncbi:UvrD-helicase domain-containing protein [Chloroflexota bacterium]
MKYKDLDEKQKDVVKAVLERDSKILVLGGAGTGKTTVALWSARKLLEPPVDQRVMRVLFLTFSRSAVSQLMKRSPGVISGYEHNVEIMTFHSLAYWLISIFGRYAGYGREQLSIQSEARRKLLGDVHGHLSYSNLLPGAIGLLDSPEIRKLISSRWRLIVCDEVQDTNKEQWELLQILSPPKLLLLGDDRQMIYTFIPGVSPRRFAQVRDLVDQVIELRPVSHRDPSGAIPALAEAIRCRRFDDPAVLEALGSGRLTVIRANDDSEVSALIKHHITGNPRKEIGVFAHSNAAVAHLADQLTEDNIDHVLVGIPEAHAEALTAMGTECGLAVGLNTPEDMSTAIATFLTAVTRGKRAPELAYALLGRMTIPGEIEEALEQLQAALNAAADGTMADLASVAMRSWQGLRIRAGSKSWQHAAGHFRRIAYPYRNRVVSEESVALLNEAVGRSRVEALIDLDYSERGRARLMNYHQTKGREADIVIHVFHDNDYFGPEEEPFEELSRLLNVALSRARERVIVLLPPNPHPLVEPFGALIRSAL